MSEFLIVTGLSGAGGSTAATVFEDLGWFVIDNLPPPLIPKVAELATAPINPETERIALVAWTSPFLEDLLPAIDQLTQATGQRARVLFLEASDEVLIRRYEDKRRRHPVQSPGGVADSIERERQLLEPVKARADVVVDTTDLNVHQLRQRLIDLFAGEGDGHASTMQTTVMSFGYKHGIPLDVDNVFDCRFLPNPHWIDELRPLTGKDQPVKDYVLAQPETSTFLEHIGHLLDLLLPAYAKEGKSYLTFAVGCTGGRHRSVVLAQELARLIEERGITPHVVHRDVERT
jgi:UPF0042 nucleotide-binding protein